MCHQGCYECAAVLQDMRTIGMGYCQLFRAGICSRALTATVMLDKYGEDYVMMGWLQLIT